jgi:methyltransferase (TIGR00027 family)
MLRAEMDGPSTTALMVAAYRGRATAREDRVCDDPWAARLAGSEGHDVAQRYDEAFGHMELWIALRTAFFDDRVRQLTSSSGVIRQVVLLGAGFDTRAARLARAGVRFFEVDREETQAVKKARLAELEGYPEKSATYVTCDFERQDFLERLGGSGYRIDQPALFLWEGVTPYLTEPAVRATLHRIAEGAHPGSVVVFDHLRRKIVLGDVRDTKDQKSRDFVAGLGEPLCFGVDYPLPLLYEEGFRKVRMLTFDEVALNRTGTYDRARAFRFQGIALASRAAAELL